MPALGRIAQAAPAASSGSTFGTSVPARIGQPLNLADQITNDAGYQRNRLADALALRRRGFGMYAGALADLVVAGALAIAMGGPGPVSYLGAAAAVFLCARAWRDYQNAMFRGAPALTAAGWILAGAGLAVALAVFFASPVIVADQIAHLAGDVPS